MGNESFKSHINVEFIWTVFINCNVSDLKIRLLLTVYNVVSYDVFLHVFFYVSFFTLQWREASFTTSTSSGDSQTYRVYAVCEVAQTNVNNWLRTPYISRQGANRLYIETKFTMRECTVYPNPNYLQQCKEKFNLLYYEADSNFANAMMPTWDTMSYRHIDAIAADQEFSDINNAVINTKVRDIPIAHNGVYFAYQDTGACTSLISVKVYYIYCDVITINFAKFEKTSTGSELTSVVQQTGVCVENATMDSKFLLLLLL